MSHWCSCMGKKMFMYGNNCQVFSEATDNKFKETWNLLKGIAENVYAGFFHDKGKQEYRD